MELLLKMQVLCILIARIRKIFIKLDNLKRKQVHLHTKN